MMVNIKKELYNINTLKTLFYAHKDYYTIVNGVKKQGIDIRLPSIPCDVSENMIKLILHQKGDPSSSWDYNKKDLLSSKEGIQECKCFTSTGPISFSPTSNWDCIYFLDATNWLNDTFKLYKHPYKRTTDEWRNIKISKSETFEQQSNQGRRPRINWKGLYPQLINCELIFEGSFENIIENNSII